MIHELLAQTDECPWIADFTTYIVGQVIPSHFSYQQWKKFLFDAKHYFWEDPFPYKLYADLVVRRCVSHLEGWEILRHCHLGRVGGLFSANHTALEVLEALFLADAFYGCPNICWNIFDVWGLDFIGSFPNSNRNKYVLVTVDYVSEWVEAQSLPSNDARVLVKFLKNYFHYLVHQGQSSVIKEHTSVTLNLKK